MVSTLTALALLHTACGWLHVENAFPLVWLAELQALHSLPEVSRTSLDCKSFSLHRDAFSPAHALPP